MNLNDLTIGEVKEILEMFGNTESKTMDKCETDILSSFIGKYVICRSRNDGINAGIVVDADGTGVHLKDARRIWYHKPKEKTLSWYEGVAESGLSEDSKISNAVDKIIVEDYSLTICSKIAEENIKGKDSNGQN